MLPSTNSFKRGVSFTRNLVVFDQAPAGGLEITRSTGAKDSSMPEQRSQVLILPQPALPKDDLENSILGVWEQYLDAPGNISINDNFWQLGGTSLQAGESAEMRSRLAQRGKFRLYTQLSP